MVENVSKYTRLLSFRVRCLDGQSHVVSLALHKDWKQGQTASLTWSVQKYTHWYSFISLLSIRNLRATVCGFRGSSVLYLTHRYDIDIHLLISILGN